MERIARKYPLVHFNSQFLRFVFVGIVNTTLAYAVYAIALTAGFLYPAASFIALVSGIVVSFISQGKYVFDSLEYRQFWRFLLCWVLMYCVNVCVIRQLVELQFNHYVAGALALPVVAVLSFMVQKHFVFARVKPVCNSHLNIESDNHSGSSKRQ